MTEPALPQPKKRRRDPGDHSIYQRKSDGRWIVEIRLGHKPNGRPDIKYLTAKDDKTAKRRLKEAVASIARGESMTNDKKTVESYLTYWLENVVKRSNRESTYNGYASICKNHLIPALGKRQLSKLTAQDIQVMLGKMIDGGTSPTTAKNARAVLRKAINDQIREDGLAIRNIVSMTKMPQQRNFHANPIMPNEVDVFLSAASGHRLETLFMLLSTLGLRTGEAYGLRWQDVDLSSSALTVRYQIQRLGKPKTAQFVDTKTEKSRSPVPIPAQLLESLKQHRDRQAIERVVAGRNWKGVEWQNLVFCTTTGTPLFGTSVMAEYRAILERAGLDTNRRLHDLRHTCGAMLAHLNVHPRIAQAILRHANVTTTLNVYTQVSDQGVRSAIDMMDVFLARNRVESEELES